MQRLPYATESAMIGWDEIVPNYPVVRWNRGKYDRAAARGRRAQAARHHTVRLMLVSAAITVFFIGLFLAAILVWALAFNGA